MLIQKELQKIFRELGEGSHVELKCDGSNIHMRTADGTSKLFLSTSVYQGGNYIPSSVRGSLDRKAPFSAPSIRTFMTIEESRFEIFLHYVGTGSGLTRESMKELIEEFGWVAGKWRDYLDEQDRNDLVHVRKV